LKNSGLGAYFDHVIVSDEVGVNKPDAKIFEAMAEIIQEDNKDTMIIIGDSLTSDIQGGLNYGIKTIWFNPKKKINQTDIKAHYEVHKLEEITPLLV
jgi:FMN phosphatase YigB (HAD superfamily)